MWQQYPGEIYHATDPKMLTGKPAFQSQQNQGTVYFDDFVIKEYDKDYLNSVLTRSLAWGVQNNV